MNPNSVHGMFHFTFEKSATEIKDAARAKIVGLETKIVERECRIAKLREEHQIDDVALVQLLVAARTQAKADRFSYTPSSTLQASGARMEERTIGAGVVNHLLTEKDFVESERASVRRLKLIVANLRPLDRVSEEGVRYQINAFSLGYDELEWLGFTG